MTFFATLDYPFKIQMGCDLVVFNGKESSRGYYRIPAILYISTKISNFMYVIIDIVDGNKTKYRNNEKV